MYILLSVDSRESCTTKKCEADVEQINWPTLAGCNIVKDGSTYHLAHTGEKELKSAVYSLARADIYALRAYINALNDTTSREVETGIFKMPVRADAYTKHYIINGGIYHILLVVECIIKKLPSEFHTLSWADNQTHIKTIFPRADADVLAHICEIIKDIRRAAKPESTGGRDPAKPDSVEVPTGTNAYTSKELIVADYRQDTLKAQIADDYPQDTPKEPIAAEYPQDTPKEPIEDEYPQDTTKKLIEDDYPQDTPKEQIADEYPQDTLKEQIVDDYPQDNNPPIIASMLNTRILTLPGDGLQHTAMWVALCRIKSFRIECYFHENIVLYYVHDSMLGLSTCTPADILAANEFMGPHMTPQMPIDQLISALNTTDIKIVDKTHYHLAGERHILCTGPIPPAHNDIVVLVGILSATTYTDVRHNIVYTITGTCLLVQIFDNTPDPDACYIYKLYI